MKVSGGLFFIRKKGLLAQWSGHTGSWVKMDRFFFFTCFCYRTFLLHWKQHEEE